MERSIPTKGDDLVHRRSANKSPGGKEEYGQSTLETSSLLNPMERSNDASSPTKGEDVIAHRRSTNKSPSGEEEHGRFTLKMIKLGQELLGPIRWNSEWRQLLHNSLAKQYSFRELIKQQKKEEEQEQASTPHITERQPNLTELHDKNDIALLILGWDKDTDTDNNDNSFCPSLLGKSGQSGRSGGSTMLSLQGSFQNNSNGNPLHSSLDRPRMTSLDNCNKNGANLLIAMME